MQKKLLSIIMILNSLVFCLAVRAEVVPFGGVEKVQLPSEMKLSVVTEKDFDLSDDQGARRYWKTVIGLKHKEKIVWEKVHREFNDLKWVYGNIVPIRKGQYFSDINGDGFIEVAILPWDFGMAEYRTVDIYSVKKIGLKKYGQGKYHFEHGPHVLLNCPRCSKFDRDACSTCE